jgi:hypothetical protein
MCVNHASSDCECCAAADSQPPVPARITSGVAALPPDMYRVFAAWFTTWSIAQAMKSMCMISATGRMPASAAPTEYPTMAASEIGVSRTRSGPNRSSSPWVAP